MGHLKKDGLDPKKQVDLAENLNTTASGKLAEENQDAALVETEMPISKKTVKRRTTAYLAKIAVLSALASVLYTLVRFPLFPAPYNYVEVDIASLPAILGGFALGPVAAVLIEALRILLKLLYTGSTTIGVGEMSNFIASAAFVLPASLIYKYKKTKNGALLGLVVGITSNLIVSSLSNYFWVLPVFSTQVPFIMEIRIEFSFIYAPIVNLTKTLVTSMVAFFLYKHLSNILHL
ncbi:MAG: ECF transporter S component [Christensenellaceae bacterium]|jgi:riboflavin transporter FmnP|nr:ECF transporter S component [Christensenellaceae bacterium]